MPRRFADTVTIPTTRATLYSLLAAIDANAPRNCMSIRIVGEDTNTQPCYMGGANVASTHFTDKFINGGDIVYKSTYGNNLHTNDYWLVAASGTQVLHIEVEVF